jgi:formamidopyrimidine-DNA glycosylase
MPELPEVEILVRHLRPLLHGRTIQGVAVRRHKVLAPTTSTRFKRQLVGATFTGLTRRGKYLLFEMRAADSQAKFVLLGHLGMTGRMYVASKQAPLAKHAAVILDLGRQQFIYDDPRAFGRLTLDIAPVAKLGPEPLDDTFTAAHLAEALRGSRQAVKVKLLDQERVAGIGNIYASEALFRAGLSPRRAANRIRPPQVQRLWRAIREVLAEAIECGSTIPLNFSAQASDGLFYYGSADGGTDFYTERLRIYDRAGQPCVNCGTQVRRLVQAARSTFFCPQCQKS